MSNNNPLVKYFYSNKEELIFKWLHYFDIYHSHFSKFRRKKIVVLEFGVWHGGSLKMWRKYFGRRARIIGVDINPACKELQSKGIEIYIGDQEDKNFLKSLMEKIGPIDVVIEDGGHTMKQQINTFEVVYPYVNNGGVYLVEDLHTSYWKRYGGGYKNKGSFIEYAKNLIDDIHAWRSEDTKKLKVSANTRSIRSMHVYESVIVFDKDEVIKPSDKITGTKKLKGVS